MPFHVAHENTELPPLSRGRQEQSAARATQFLQDPNTTLSESSNKLIVATGGGSHPGRNPAPPKSSVRLSLADAAVTKLLLRVMRTDLTV